MADTQSGYIQAIIATIALLTSVAVFWITLSRDAARKKVELTIDIWKFWLSSDMRKARRLVGNRFLLTRSTGDIKYEAKTFASITAGDKPEDTQINDMYYGTIVHFIIEVGELYRGSLINKPLFYRLFKPTLAHWKARFEAVIHDFRDETMREYHDNHKLVLETLSLVLIDPKTKG